MSAPRPYRPADLPSHRLTARLLVSALTVGCIGSLAAQGPAKKLIEFGWDRPLVSWASQHPAALDSTPFAGVVFQFRAGTRFLTRQALDPQAFRADSTDLSAIHPRNLTDNFVLVGATPDSGWDWYDDSAWAVGLTNLRSFARTARVGGLVGIFLDLEPYGTNPWRYDRQPARASRSYDEMSRQVRSRGREFMRTLQEEFPGLRIVTPFLLSYNRRLLTLPDSAARARSLPAADYGLIPPFVNGMLDAIAPNVRIVDGNEAAYYYQGRLPFFDARRAIQTDLVELVDPGNRARYQQQVEPGQAVFVDQLLGLRDDPGPAARLAPADRLRWLEHNVYYALQTATRYAWCYGQKVDWWKGRVPEGADSILRRAIGLVNGGKPLGFEIEPLWH